VDKPLIYHMSYRISYYNCIDSAPITEKNIDTLDKCEIHGKNMKNSQQILKAKLK